MRLGDFDFQGFFIYKHVVHEEHIGYEYPLYIYYNRDHDTVMVTSFFQMQTVHPSYNTIIKVFTDEF